MAQFRYTGFGHIVISEQDDPGEVIDTIITGCYPFQYCFAESFDTAFLTRLLKAGFLLMSSESADGLFTAQPCHHLTVSVLFFDNIHIPKQIKRLLGRYELRYDAEFDTIVDKCIQKHGGGWLTKPLVEAIKAIKKAGDDNCTFTSFGLYRNGQLVAGEFGSTTGRIYTSYSGYYDESSAGTVQMILTAQYLRSHGYALWNFGMPLPYKAYLGGRIVNLRDFIALWRKYVHQTPQHGMAFEASPCCKENPTDYELLEVLQDAYKFLYINDLGYYLSDNFIYTGELSGKLFNNTKSKTEYLEYISYMVKEIEYYAGLVNGITTEIQTTGPRSVPCLLLRQGRAEVMLDCTTQNGKITAINAKLLR